MARRRGISSSIPALLIIIVGIIVVITIWRNKNFLNFSSAAPALAAGQIYPGADPVHECNNVSDGEFESGNDRREPQIACGFNFLNSYASTHDSHSKCCCCCASTCSFKSLLPFVSTYTNIVSNLSS